MALLTGNHPADDSAPEAMTTGNYVVVARRYRPQDFQQLVGQPQVSQALGTAIHTNRVGHAYLFTGARGVGKTSTARIFAKALNCVRGPTTEPCGECDICQGIAAGSDVDVLEIDGASNRGIDEIRQLRSNVNVRPSRARYKIYIIDEVHMLTTQAFNALLKTLEEPPEHVKFIFCTTEADKIPITVLSRCQRFDFAPLQAQAIVDRLQHICNLEGVTVEPQALQILARRANGSMRDSQSLLEQLLSFSGKQLLAADVHRLLGTAQSGRLAAISRALADHDAATALGLLDEALRQGVDAGQLAEQLLGYLRDAMAVHLGCSTDLLLSTEATDADELRQLGDQLGLETVLAAAQVLDQALVRMKQSTQTRTLVELALVRIANLQQLQSLPALIAQLQSGGPISLPTAPAVARPAQSLAPVARDSQPSGPPMNQARPTPAPQPPVPPPQPAVDQKKTTDVAEPLNDEPAAPQDEVPWDDQMALSAWRQVLSQIQDMTSDYASRAESVATSGPNQLVARFRKAYTHAKETCERPERRQRLEQGLTELMGRPIRVEFQLLPDEPQTVVAAPRPPQTAIRRRQRIREVERNLLVQQAIVSFEAEIVNVIDPPVSADDATEGATDVVVAPTAE
ncbi:DNA polymerase III subunit tau [Anatilimnocola aggregata]|uniref:DNA polymerase III subunit gamma/tau n=1 Tax=Anatilimnocola aggregata TaxID=2528021 RepID=A0A517YMN9_9BACT|nr:DNA polymerase III subunit gamma/tau [Anatilimnocola aggregata]QDU31490.1 DNA polymerase III subunit tau [Anatilimnocola aggregata]